MNASSPIKWAGGKAKSLPILLQVAPKEIDCYYEPFAGGASLFWALANEGRFRAAQISDCNRYLINFYAHIQQRTDMIGAALDTMAPGEERTEEEYKRIRSMRPEDMSFAAKAAWFLYLNKTCFNGLWRENNRGEFNVPWGKKKKVKFFDPENIQACHSALQNVVVTSNDFESAVSQAGEEDFVYLDSPYLPISKTSDFTSYSEGGFPMSEHARVAYVFRNLHRRGVKVALSNSDCDATRILYAGFHMIKVPTRRNVGASAESRQSVNDLLILANMEPPK